MQNAEEAMAEIFEGTTAGMSPGEAALCYASECERCKAAIIWMHTMLVSFFEDIESEMSGNQAVEDAIQSLKTSHNTWATALKL